MTRMSDGAMSKKATENLLKAGFNAGWASACLTLADEMRKAGEVASAKSVEGWANHPPEIQCADLATPEGQAMKAASEVVFMDNGTGRSPGQGD